MNQSSLVLWIMELGRSKRVRKKTDHYIPKITRRVVNCPNYVMTTRTYSFRLKEQQDVNEYPTEKHSSLESQITGNSKLFLFPT